VEDPGQVARASSTSRLPVARRIADASRISLIRPMPSATSTVLPVTSIGLPLERR
jgi:hypothetical protein